MTVSCACRHGHCAAPATPGRALIALTSNETSSSAQTFNLAHTDKVFYCTCLEKFAQRSILLVISKRSRPIEPKVSAVDESSDNMPQAVASADKTLATISSPNHLVTSSTKDKKDLSSLQGDDMDPEFEYGDDVPALLGFDMEDHYAPANPENHYNRPTQPESSDSVETGTLMNSRDDMDIDTATAPVVNTSQASGLHKDTNATKKHSQGKTQTMKPHAPSQVDPDDGSDDLSDPPSSIESDSDSGSDDGLDAYELESPISTKKLPPRKPSTSLPVKRDAATAFAKHGRPHSTTLDATDTLIFDLKSAGHSDKTVSAELRARSLTIYEPKTISTRYRRLREAHMAETDGLLARGRRQWTDEEDQALMGAYVEALQRQDEEIRKVRKRLYKTTAFLVAERCQGQSFFSAQACERRYRDLMAGKAVTEKDMEDPEVRKTVAGRRLQMGWELEVGRLMREEWTWEDGLVEELVALERERREGMRKERGGTVRTMNKLRAEQAKTEEKSTGSKRGGGVKKSRGGRSHGRPRGRGKGGSRAAA